MPADGERAWRKVSQFWPEKPRSITADHRMMMFIPEYRRPVAAFFGTPSGARDVVLPQG